jgi:hypothetical protein
MFVRDQNRVKAGRVYAYQDEAPQYLPGAETGIHQNICFFGADKNCIAGRTAAENCKSHHFF